MTARVRSRGLAAIAVLATCILWHAATASHAGPHHGWQLEELPTLISNDATSSSSSDSGLQCDDTNTVNGTCTLEGIRVTLFDTNIINVTNSLFIINCNVTIRDSVITAATLTISAMNVEVDGNTSLIADAMGPQAEPPYAAWDGMQGTGGGHGGIGSIIFTCRQSVPVPKPVGGQGFGFENVSMPFDFGGGSTPFYGVSGATRGGGRIWIEALGIAQIAGTLSADGEASPNTKCRCDAGGGAGGSIYIGANLVDVVGGTFSAKGGSAAYTGGGGGGIVSFIGCSVNGAPSTAVDVAGGATTDTCCQACPIGGTGIVFRRQLAARFGTADPVNASSFLRLHPRRQELVVPMLPSAEEFESRARHVLSDCVGAMAKSRAIFADEDGRLITSLQAGPKRLADPQVHYARAMTSEGITDDDENVFHVTRSRQSSSAAQATRAVSDEEACRLHYPDFFDRDQVVQSSSSLACQSWMAYSSQSPMMATAVTQLDSSNNVAMSNCAWDLSSLQSVTLVSWKVGTSNVQAEGLIVHVNGTFAILDLSRVYTSASAIMSLHLNQSLAVQQSLLDAGTLAIYTPSSVSVTQQAYTRFTFALMLTAATVQLSSVMSQVDIPPVTTTVTLFATNMTMQQESSILAGLIVLNVANTLTINGGVTGAQSFGAQNGCPFGHSVMPVPVVQTVDCNMSDPLQSGFTVWIHANDLDIQKSGEILGSTIRVCANTVEVEPSAELSADGLGCGSESGYGAGTSQISVASSGAGHGAVGGAGVGTDGVSSVPGGEPYDNATFPRMLGSGGGDSSLGGNGGGLIWMEVPAVLTMGGTISAIGEPGLTAVTPTGSGGGGGSGGSFILYVGSLVGQSGVFDFSGGNGAAPGGGGGSGGVIDIVWLNGTADATEYSSQWFQCVAYHAEQRYRLRESSGVFTREQFFRDCHFERPQRVERSESPLGASFRGVFRNTGGGGAAPGLPGQHGVAFSIPTCELGQGGALCLPCATGTYKDTAGDNEPCEPCPVGSFANVTGSSACYPCPPGSVSPSPGASDCRTCTAGFKPNVNRTKCDLCELGHGGPMCLPCSPGSAKNDSSQNQCELCDPGTAAPSAGMVACISCRGQKAPTPGTVQCIPCDAGSVSVPPYVNCSVCPGGSFAFPQTDECAPCQPNTYSTGGTTSCSTCSPGEFSLGNATECSTCAPKPTHSEWVDPAVYSAGNRLDGGAEGNFKTCVYVCDTGYVHWPSCVLPIELAYDSTGGMAIYIAIAALSFISLIPACIAWQHHGSNRTLHAWVPDTDENQQDVNREVDAYLGITPYERMKRGRSLCGGSDDDDDQPPALSPASSNAHLRSRLLSRGPGLNTPLVRGASGRFTFHGATQSLMSDVTSAGAGYAGLRGAGMFSPSTPDESGAPVHTAAQHGFFAPKLSVSDLPRHIQRIYFLGNNSPFTPLFLEPAVPSYLHSVLIEHEFIEHAEEINNVCRWRNWEVRAANLLRTLYHPCALAFERARRAAHIKKLASMYAELDHVFLKNTRARALGNCVRFGHSHDHTLAWIDIMASDANEDAGTSVGQPQYPAVIPCAGDGSFVNPFHVELSDPLNIALLSLLSPDFQSIIVGLNNMLRLLRGPTMSPGLQRRHTVRYDDGSASSSFRQQLVAGFGGRRVPAGSESPRMLSRTLRTTTEDSENMFDEVGDRLRHMNADDDDDDSYDDDELPGPSQNAPVAHSTMCCAVAASNTMQPLETQSQIHNIQEYLGVVNNTLKERSKAAKRAQEALTRRKTGNRRASTNLHRLTSSGELNVSTFSLDQSADERRIWSNEQTIDAALRWVPFGFPNEELLCYFGKIPVDASCDRPCIILLPRTAPQPSPSGNLSYKLSYGAQVLAQTSAPSLFKRSVGLPSAPKAGGSINDAANSKVSTKHDYRSRVREGTNGRPPKNGCCSASNSCWSSLGRVGQYVPALRNARASGSFLTITLLLQFALLLELMMTCLMLSAFYGLISDAFVVLLCAPPLMLPLSPLLGHAALVTGKPSHHRMHSSMELQSCISAFIALCYGGVYTVRGSLDYYVGAVVPLCLLLIKFLVLRLSNTRIALLELQLEALRFAPDGVVYVREVLASIGNVETPVAAGSESGRESDASPRKSMKSPKLRIDV